MSIVLSALLKGQKLLRYPNIYFRGGKKKNKTLDIWDFLPAHTTSTAIHNKYPETNEIIAHEYLSYRS